MYTAKDYGKLIGMEGFSDKLDRLAKIYGQLQP